jgi:hypothetical protein
LQLRGGVVHMNDQTMYNIFNSFRIFSSLQAQSLTDLHALQSRALEWQLAFQAQSTFYQTALHGILSVNPGMYRFEDR